MKIHPAYHYLRYVKAGDYVRELPEIAGMNLACWCPVGASCHADVLLELANPKARQT